MQLKRHSNLVVDLETSGSCPIKNGVISVCFLVTTPDDEIIEKRTYYVKPNFFSKDTWDLESQRIHKIRPVDVAGFMPNDEFCFDFLNWISKFKDLFPLNFICHSSPSGMPKIHKETKNFLGGWEIVPWFDFTFLDWCFKDAKYSNGSTMNYTFYKIFGFNKVGIETPPSESNKEGKTTFKVKRNPLISTIKMARDAGYKGNKLSEWADRLGIILNHHEVESDTLCCLEVYKFLRKYDRQKNQFEI